MTKTVTKTSIRIAELGLAAVCVLALYLSPTTAMAGFLPGLGLLLIALNWSHDKLSAKTTLVIVAAALVTHVLLLTH